MSSQPDSRSNAQSERGSRALRVIDGDPAALGRVPPHSLEAEEFLLSCCLLDGGETIARCMAERLQPQTFYFPPNRIIFEKLCILYVKSPPVGIEMLIEELRTSQQLEAIGGVNRLVEISARIPTTAQAVYFIEKLRELWLLREAIRQCTDHIERSFAWQGGELEEHLGAVAARFARMADYAAGRHEGTMAQQAARARVLGESLANGKQDRSRWLALGLAYVDGKLTPFDANNEDWLVVFAGPPSGGKSSVIRQATLHNLEAEKRGAAFLLETGARGWLLRMAATAAVVNVRDIPGELKERQVHFREWQAKIESWCQPAGQRLWVFDDVYTIDGISAKVRALHRELAAADPQHRGLDFIIVDYLQLVTPSNLRAQREQQVAEISRRLKTLAKTHNLTAFVASQLNRAGRAAERPPKLEDLRESGAIEQDADRVIALYTPEVDDTGLAQDLNAETVYVQLHQLKNRNGPVGWSWARFTRRTTRFDDVPHKHQGAPGSPKPADGYKRNRP